MTQEEFEGLSIYAQLAEIYRILPKPPGESPLAGILGKGVHIPPTLPPAPEYPQETIQAIGAPPADRNRLAIWKQNKLAKFGGVIDISGHKDYHKQKAKAAEYGLGEPLAYIYDGQTRLTFKNPEMAGLFSAPLEEFWKTDTLLLWSKAQGLLKALGVDLSNFKTFGKPG